MATKFLDKLDYDFDIDKGLGLIDKIYTKYSIPYSAQKLCRTSKSTEQELKHAMKKISKLEKALLQVIGVSKIIAGNYRKNIQKQAELNSPTKTPFEEPEKIDIEIIYNPVKSINVKLNNENDNLKSRNYEENIKELQDLLQEKERLLQENENLIEEKDGLIQEKDDIINEKTSEIEEMQGRIEELEDDNDDLNEKLSEKTKALKSSKSKIESLNRRKYLEKYEEEVNSHSKTKSILYLLQSNSRSNDFETYSSRCQATTQKGNQCRRNAQSGSSYCWQH